MTSSARLSAARMSATLRPWSFASASSATSASVLPCASASRMASASVRYMSGTHLVKPEGPAHPRQRADLVADALGRRLVDLDHHERVAARVLPAQAQRRDVQVVL